MQSSGAARAFSSARQDMDLRPQPAAEDAALYAVRAEPSVQAAYAPARQAYADKPVYEALKRAGDVVLASLGLLAASPIMLVAAIAIKAEDGGPVIHKRICIGRNRKPYAMYKFRSMVINADDLDHMLTEAQKQQYMREVKIENDPRITKVGRFLRKTSIDELPQLITVLQGAMSLVGPRPMVEFENELFGAHADEVLLARPGLTGYWQVHGRNTKKYETGERQAMELYYIRNRSLWLDIKIVFATVLCVLRCEGN